MGNFGAPMRTIAFIDASSLFYGGEKSLGWKIDYGKLKLYLKRKYDADSCLYFGGVELHDFPHDELAHESVDLAKLNRYLNRLTTDSSLSASSLEEVEQHLKRVRFYRRLEKFGYALYLKPVKSYRQDDGTVKRKANCDVDMTFYMMRDLADYDRAVVLTGDGDFLPVLKHIRALGKGVVILGRGPRTARVIRRFAGTDFRDFEYLKEQLAME